MTLERKILGIEKNELDFIAKVKNKVAETRVHVRRRLHQSATRDV